MAKLLNRKKIIKQLEKEIIKQSEETLKKAAKDIARYTEELYNEYLYTFSYSPLSNDRNFSAVNPVKANYYKGIFKKREATSYTTEPKIKTTIKDGKITIHSFMSNGQGKINNVWYFRDLGTNPEPQKATTRHGSPFFGSGPNWVKTGQTPAKIQAENWSKKIGDKLESYIKEYYKDVVAIKELELPTHDSLEWNFDPILKEALPIINPTGGIS